MGILAQVQVAARDPRVRALSIEELNPTRCAGDPEALPRFAGGIARILAGTIHERAGHIRSPGRVTCWAASVS
jgi:hypothetical protein